MRARAIRSVLDRCMDKISPEPNTGCWLWTGSVLGDFAFIYVDKRPRSVGTILFGAVVPAGKVVRSRCRVKLCVNPAHLEVVDVRFRRGTCFRGHALTEETTYLNTGGRRTCSACRVYRRTLKNRGNANRAKTTCPDGHPYDEANTRVTGGKRKCRACAREHARFVRAFRRSQAVVEVAP